jgi:hypothetical protein
MTSTPGNCVSHEHEPPVPGTIQGTFNNPYSDKPPLPALYCQPCADLIGSMGFFTPDPTEKMVEG